MSNYVTLLHGRAKPDDIMGGQGSIGPTFQVDRNTVIMARNYYTDLVIGKGKVLKQLNGCFFYGGKWYGEIAIMNTFARKNNKQWLVSDVRPFEPALAKLPVGIIWMPRDMTQPTDPGRTIEGARPLILRK